MDAKELLQQESLRDLKRLSVVVEDPAPEAAVGGLSKSQLHYQVKCRLHRANIEILPEERIYPGVPYLYVNVNVMKTRVGLDVFATQVALKQQVILPREPFVQMHAATWEIAGVGTVGSNHLAAIPESVCQLIDQFGNDYRLVNSAAYFGEQCHLQ